MAPHWLCRGLALLSSFLVLLFAEGALAAPQVSVSEAEGLPVVAIGGANAMSSAFVFWSANWTWAAAKTDFKIEGPFAYTLAASVAALDLGVAGRIGRPQERQLSWDLDLEARSGKKDAVGGLAFKFDLPAFGAAMGEPELLPGKRGWAWGRAGGGRVEMRFDPPLAALDFERGEKSEIRAYFYFGELAPGKRHVAATLTVSGDATIAPTPTERHGLDALAPGQIDNPSWRISPIDLSFLNAQERPAGKRGFVKAEQGRLVFADGSAARFWGTNVTAAALFATTKEQVRQQARRLSMLGFNLVRIHHHDSAWVDPNIFGDQKTLADTQTLSAAMLDKLDWWIKCLKGEGIYVWLDLHVGRTLRRGDPIDGFDEIAKGQAAGELKGYNYVNPSIRQAMRRFNEAYVTHRNAYTGVPYAEEPAIAAFLITNENDVTHHFGNVLLPDKGVPRHNALYMSQARAFAERHGLPADRAWQSWQHGASKLFLNDLEHQFDVEMIEHLRRLGVRAPIVTTSSWGGDPLSSLPALTSGDMVDVHAYGGAGEIERDPRYKATLVHWMAAAHVAGKPLSVTEWNVEPFVVRDRHTIPLYVAAAARLQGWDAMMLYAYSQAPLDGPGTPSNWHAFNDPALLAVLPAAALLYRAGHVREATTTYVYAPSAPQLFGRPVTPDTSPALRTAAEKGKLLIAMPAAKELPWLKPGPARTSAGTTVFADPEQDLAHAGTKGAIVSDTGELRRDWHDGIYTIDTAQTQAAMGWIGGKTVSLADVSVELATRNATVAVQSLDGEPIRQSRSILLSLAAQSAPRVPGRLPFVSEAVAGTLRIAAPAGLAAYAVNMISGGLRPLPHDYRDGRYVIAVGKAVGSHWLVLRDRIVSGGKAS